MTEILYYVYIMSNPAGITYVGMTNDIMRRVREHKVGKSKGFSSKYGTTKLVYYEEIQYVEDAIAREKQIKSWRKEKKRAPVRSLNPKWNDLSESWYED